MAEHPDLPSEQAHVDRAYQRIEAMRDAANRILRSALQQGGKETTPSLGERAAMVRISRDRLTHRAGGNVPLSCGRIATEAGEALRLGRLAVSDEDHEP